MNGIDSQCEKERQCFPTGNVVFPVEMSGNDKRKH
jgi:hypothetical protein